VSNPLILALNSPDLLPSPLCDSHNQRHRETRQQCLCSLPQRSPAG